MAYSSRSRALAEGAAAEIQTNVQTSCRVRDEQRPVAANAWSALQRATVTGGSSAAALLANLIRRDLRDDCGR